MLPLDSSSYKSFLGVFSLNISSQYLLCFLTPYSSFASLPSIVSLNPSYRYFLAILSLLLSILSLYPYFLSFYFAPTFYPCSSSFLVIIPSLLFLFTYFLFIFLPYPFSSLFSQSSLFPKPYSLIFRLRYFLLTISSLRLPLHDLISTIRPSRFSRLPSFYPSSLPSIFIFFLTRSVI
jgi:hypothetical protein